MTVLTDLVTVLTAPKTVLTAPMTVLTVTMTVLTVPMAGFSDPTVVIAVRKIISLFFNISLLFIVTIDITVLNVGVC